MDRNISKIIILGFNLFSTTKRRIMSQFEGYHYRVKNLITFKEKEWKLLLEW